MMSCISLTGLERKEAHTSNKGYTLISAFGIFHKLSKKKTINSNL